MSRASFTGVLTCSYVTFHVKAFSVASDQKETLFKNLHKSCMAPTVQETRCSYCQAKPTQDDTIKGFEHQGGWIPLNEEASAALKPADEEKGLFQVKQIAARKEIPPELIAKHYWLVPGETQAEKPYALFRRVLSDMKRIAVVTFSSRGRAHLSIVEPHQEGLVLRVLYYPQDMKALDDHAYQVGQVSLQPQEVRLAREVIARLDGPFLHQDYPDVNETRKQEVKEAVLASKPVSTPTYKVAAPMESLIKALERSLKELPKKKKKTVKR